jgi:hypothetical protein
MLTVMVLLLSRRLLGQERIYGHQPRTFGRSPQTGKGSTSPSDHVIDTDAHLVTFQVTCVKSSQGFDWNQGTYDLRPLSYREA